jgi:site-specific recombinase XerC
MRFRAADAYQHLPRVDPGRLFAGSAVGLRDGALLALLAAGLTSVEISTLRASAVTMNDGEIQIAIQRQGIIWSATLPTALGARLLAWLSEGRLWGEDVPLFTSRRGGPLSHAGISGVLHRYRHHPPARKCIKRRKRK